MAKWPLWIGFSGPNSTVGAYQGACTWSRGLYRPETNCAMNTNFPPFCTICREQIIKSFHAKCTMLGTPQPATPLTVAQFTNLTFSFVNRLAARPHSLRWRIDSGPWVAGTSSFVWAVGNAPVGPHTVTVRLRDTSPEVRNDPTSLLLHTWTWKVTVVPRLPAGRPLVPANNIVGWVSIGGAAPGRVELQDVDRCRPARVRCASSTGSTALPYAGGTAYDPREQAVWVSDGGTIFSQSLQNCGFLCQLEPAMRSPKAVVSGLAVADRKRQLFHLETAPGYYGIVIYDDSKCPPKAIRSCTFTLAGKSTAAGLAYDELRDILYVGSGQSIFLRRASAPCQLICHPFLRNCGTKLGPITGLGYDACTKFLYATDGRTIQRIEIASVGQQGCVTRPGPCCPKGTKGSYRGLAVVPGWSKRVVGKPCSQSPCPSCPSMTADLYGGVPGLGNQEFGISLGKAPPGQQAYLALALGPCTAGLPVFCGRFHPNLANPNLIFGPMLTSGRGICDGTARSPLPIPVDTSFCGQWFCVQWVVLCRRGTEIGIGFSNAVQFTTTGS